MELVGKSFAEGLDFGPDFNGCRVGDEVVRLLRVMRGWAREEGLVSVEEGVGGEVGVGGGVGFMVWGCLGGGWLERGREGLVHVEGLRFVVVVVGGGPLGGVPGGVGG